MENKIEVERGNDRADVESGRESISHWKLISDQGVVTKEIMEWEYEGEGTEEDPYVVEWIENDVRNPMNWSKTRKWILAIAVANTVLVVSFCSSAFSGGIEGVMREFKVSQEVVTLGISLFVLGFALGPLIWAPCSELFGRQYVFFGSSLAMVAFNAGAADAPNIYSLLILRFLAAAFGSSPLTNAGGVIADLFEAKERGLALSLFSAAPFMGPVLGPIIGGFLGMTEGWRWVHGLMAIWSGVILIITTFLVPETYPTVLLRKRAERLSKLSGKVYKSRTDIDQGVTSLGEAFSTALMRPWVLLFCEPIVLLLSLYQAIVYGILYLLFGAFPIVYRVGRGWNEGVAGLPFVAVAIGVFFAILYVVVYDNRRYMKLVAASGVGYTTPEARLPMGIIGGIVLPIGLFWFAWTNSPSVPWASSVVASIPFGFGMVLIFLSIMNYLIDSYTIFAASVLAGSGILRSLIGAAFPLFTHQMFDRLGIHWASSIPAFLALACVPLPFIFYKYGSAIRKKSKFASMADEFMQKMRAQQAAKAAQQQGPEEFMVDMSRAPTIQEEEEDQPMHEKEDEIEKKLQEGENDPRFEEMKAQTEMDQGLKKVQTGRSTRSRRSVGASEDYYDNPYEIDRVNTRESFRPRMNSRQHSNV